MKVLELYAGSRSIGKESELMGFEVCSVDITQFGNIDIVIDIENITIEHLPWIPDAVWIGIPCTSWSLAGISHHRNTDYSAKSDFAHKSDRLLNHNLKLLKGLIKINPNLIWWMENPRATLRKMPQMQGLNRVTVTYCSYGDIRMKPTDIWSNNIYDIFNEKGWKPRPMCFNGNIKCQHEPAPRGSKTGTQGLKNNHERSKMPRDLCIEILESLKTTIT